jgi:hypothetical protein
MTRFAGRRITGRLGQSKANRGYFADGDFAHLHRLILRRSVCFEPPRSFFFWGRLSPGAPALRVLLLAITIR